MVTSGKERLKTVNLVLVRCWDYIESFIEVCKQRQDDAKAAGEETSVSETLAKAFGSVVGGSCAGEGDTIPVPEPRTSLAQHAMPEREKPQKQLLKAAMRKIILPHQNRKMLSVTKKKMMRQIIPRIVPLHRSHQ